MHRTSGRIPATAAITGAFVSRALCTSLALAAQYPPVDIPAGHAVDAINLFGRETELTVVYSYDDVKGVETPAVKGQLDPLEALRELLAGSGLTFKEVGRTLVIYKIDRTAPRDAHASVATASPPDPQKPATIVVEAAAVRGEIPNLPGLEALVVTREDIETSGLATTTDLVATLPQNFGGGPNENTMRGGGAETNSGSGSGINLRGLSNGVTIVLLNGRRLAPSGTAGDFTDIANIPLAAIDHVEVIPEGATARYGIDAIGGIVNFVLKQDARAESGAEVGGLARGAVYDERLDQSYGSRWDGGNVFAVFEYYEHDALPANRRLLATSNLTAFGGGNFDTPYGNPGTILADGKLWAIPPGQNGTPLGPSQLTANTENLHDQYDGATVLPRQQLSSLLLTGQEKLTPSSTFFVDALFNHRSFQSAGQGEPEAVSVSRNNPFYVNPTGGTDPVTVLYGFGRDLGPVITRGDVDTEQITAGVDLEGGIFNYLEFYTSYAGERQHQVQDGLVNPGALEYYLNDDPNPGTAMNVFGDGSSTNPATLAAIRTQGSLTLDSELTSVDLTADRTLLHAPGGDAVLTLSEEYRKQTLESTVDSQTQTPAGLTTNTLSRTTLASFAQVSLPLADATHRVKGIESLTLSAAARYEHYSDVGAVSSPQYAVAYYPVKQVLLRGTWARLAHAPNLPDLSAANNVSYLYPLQTPGGYTTALVVNGNNPTLRPETANTWTAGMSVTPFDTAALSLGLTYFHTDFTDRISDPLSLPANALESPSFSSFVRPVTAAERAVMCSQNQFLGAPGECSYAQIGAIVDLRLSNVSSLDTQGVDLAAQYKLDGARGTWKLDLNATYLFQYTEQQTPSSPRQSLLNIDHNPINLRLRASVSWAQRGLWTKAIANFQNSYEDIDSTPSRPVSSWLTVDAAVGYDLHLRKADSQTTQLSVSARNLFNHQPPFLNNQYGIGYDQENATVLGRVISFSLRQHW
jgi:iron complex outermembrane recepter protein